MKAILENSDILPEASKSRIDSVTKTELLIADKLFLVNERGGVCNKGSLYPSEITLKINSGFEYSPKIVYGL